MPSHPNETLEFVSQNLCPSPRNISSTSITMSTCVNCGSQFLTVKGKKGSKRSLHAKLDSIERTAKDVLEEEFGLTLTPRQKETRFLCGKCSWNLAAIAKSKDTTIKSKKTFSESASASSYLTEKIRTVGYVCKKGRSPFVTPRKTKRPRLFSPEKVSSICYYCMILY